jgi:hypothetical protein
MKTVNKNPPLALHWKIAAMVRPGDITRAGQTVIGQWK